MGAATEHEEKAPHDDEIARTVARVLEEHEARRRLEEQEAKAKAERKDRLTTRVSVAALALTVLLSFLGFVRAERGSASADAEAEAALASSEAESSWVYYQTKNEQRAAYRVADDALFREVKALPPGDPRVALADVHHTEYLAHIYEISNDCRHLFSRSRTGESSRSSSAARRPASAVTRASTTSARGS